MYLDPTDESVRALIDRGIDGPLVMLNLLRLRSVADYGDVPELAPPTPISGRAAYEHYIAHTRPFLEATGGSLVMVAEGGQFFVGPRAERWGPCAARPAEQSRRLLLVREQSRVSCRNRPLHRRGRRHAALAPRRASQSVATAPADEAAAFTRFGHRRENRAAPNAQSQPSASPKIAMRTMSTAARPPTRRHRVRSLGAS